MMVLFNEFDIVKIILGRKKIKLILDLGKV